MLSLADLKFAVIENGSLYPWTWKATRAAAEQEAFVRMSATGRAYNVLSEEEFDAQHKAYWLGTFPLQEITQEFHDEMLNCLPPMYRQGAIGFFMCELTSGTITSQFVRWQNRCYGAAVDLCDRETWITPEKLDALPAAAPSKWFPERASA